MRAQLEYATQARPLDVPEGVSCDYHRDVSPKEDAFSHADAPRFERAQRELFSTHVLRKESRKSSIINKSAKIGRHTFALCDTQAASRKPEVAIA